MNKFNTNSKALLSLAVLGMSSAVCFGADLSKYRNVQLGADLPTIARQVGSIPSEAKVVHTHPAVIQELVWHPSTLESSKTEPAKEVLFSFYNGELFRISVDYDRYQTEGLTVDDIVESISATYGVAERLASPANDTRSYGAEEEVVARWQDPQYCFELIRSSYGPSFRLNGFLKRLKEPAAAAIIESKRLEDQEAPQRDAARIATEKQAEQAKLDSSRLQNKPRFRP